MSINKVILIGRLGKEPVVRYTSDNKAITNITLATSESWKDKQTRHKQEKTEWHRVIFFGKVAAVVNEYLHKGSQIYIEGKLHTKKWQDKSGQDRYTTEVVVNDDSGRMQMLGIMRTTSTETIPLKNCKFENKCSRTWESLTQTNSTDIKHCPDCDSNVHLCHTESQVTDAINQDLCIAVNIKTRHETLGFPANPDRTSTLDNSESDDVPF